MFSLSAAVCQAQQAQAEYQSKVAQRNADLAEQQASAQRMQGYEQMQAERLKTARLIGQQRAQAGASGVLAAHEVDPSVPAVVVDGRVMDSPSADAIVKAVQ